jgi:hypothetical protein
MSRTRSLLTLCLVVAASSCGSGGAGGPDALPQTVCTDGMDNDGDGSTDFPADPGCDDASDTDESNPPIAMCTDGRDNDADGLIDYPDDPGCFTPLQNSETDDCPTGPTCPSCSNDQDDDGDSLTDYPQDQGCTAASDDDEWETNPNACGVGMIVSRLMSHDVTGTLPAMSQVDPPLAGACGGLGGEVAYEILIEDPAVLVATTDGPSTTANTVLYLRSNCQVASTEMACNDDVNGDTNGSSITASLSPGLYYLVVDAVNPASAGAFELHVDLFAGEGVTCASQAECGPGLQCRIPLGQTEMVCADPVCGDGVDDDGDGDDDFPDDPGCDSPADFDEADTCPSGPGCPACANGVDDDGDSQTDYPADSDCSSASQPVEGCGVEQDPIFTLTTASANGDLVGLHDDFDLSCDGLGGLDQVHFVALPHMTSVRLDTIGSPTDTVIAVYPSSCSGTALGCNDDGGGSGTSLLNLTNVAAGAYAIVVENYSTSYPPGPYTLNLGGTIAPGGDCTGALAASGAIACGPTYACISGVCTGNLACNNGLDDDGDGDVDFPEDPGCESAVDTDEVDDCPGGASCPACSNGIDDDGDGDTDYPADADCTAAGGTAEVCGAESDPLIQMTSPSISGTTAMNAMPDFTLSCGNSGTAADRVALITVPDLSSLHLDMAGSGYDAVLALKTASCGAADLACNDSFSDGGEVINYAPTAGVPAGTYAVVVDGYFGDTGAFNLNLSGVIKNNQSCEGPLAASGALTCGAGFTCKGPAGNRTCKKTQCSDGVNNADGDTVKDYPRDPGCLDINDDDESDDCPDGPNCPACGNDDDDDGDGLIDYPQDYGCAAASGASEVACPTETDMITKITTAVINSSTTGKANDFTPSCSSGSNAPDVTYILQLPVPVVTLTIDTITTPFNTTLTFDEPTCAAPVIACDDNGAAMNTSRIVRTDVQPGAYAITVDGAGTAAGNFALHVDGRVAPGSACTGPLFAAGVLACPVGENCTAGTCQ